MPEDFQTKMLKYSKYGLSIKTTEAEGQEYFLVGVNFNTNWQIVEPSEESGVSCVAATNGEGLFYYFGPVSNGVNPIFDCIEETIQYNEDVQKKIKLLKEKVAELQELFATKPYDELARLMFTFPEDKKQPKKGRVKKSTEPRNVEKTKRINEKLENNDLGENMMDVARNASNLDTFTEPKEDFVGSEKTVETGNNIEEANEIDAKIAAALGKR